MTRQYNEVVIQMQLIVSVFPIFLLIYLMTKKKSVRSSRALPFVALVTYFISLVFLKQDPISVHASVLIGLLTAFTPLMIIAGAVFLFQVMEQTGSLNDIRSFLNDISSNKIAQLMIVGWAFGFLIEGASGFGTPAALAAPILVSLGFKPIKAALFTLIMNSIPVSFGAVGTPTWFGLSGITDLGFIEIMQISGKTAFMHSIAAFIIPIIGLVFVVDWGSIRANIIYIYISILSCVIPFLIIASINYEFPSLIGGFIGLIISIYAAKRGWGLEEKQDKVEKRILHEYSLWRLISALFPLWGIILLLIITRVPALGVKSLLTNTDSLLYIQLGNLGMFEISSAIVLTLENIFGTGNNWNFPTLYIPGIIPFFFIGIVSLLVFRSPRAVWCSAYRITCNRLVDPSKALFGALIYVKLILLGGQNAPSMIIGSALSASLGWGWNFFAAYLGALGSFFSGSNTISNLTFGAIQDNIASDLNLSRTTILAAQSVGGAMGNMVCINNIVAVCSVLGIFNAEGYILKRTIIPMIIYGLIAGGMATLFLLMSI